jgi:transitional endoplasmic reticulum ATPase
MPLPDMAARAAIIALHAARLALADGCRPADFANRTEGWSGAELANFIRMAGLAALRRSIHRGGPEAVNAADIDAAFLIAAEGRNTSKDAA